MEKDKPKRITIRQVKSDLDELRDKILTRKDWSRISVIATVVIAISTIVYVVTTTAILSQMRKDNKLQRDYYQKTVRPFIYAHTFTFENVDQPINKKSKVKIQYSLKNAGVLPAKDIHHTALYQTEVNEKFKSQDVSMLPWRKDETEICSALYPDQEIYGFRSKYRKEITLEDLMKYKWVHVFVQYEDPGGIEYFYKWVVELRITIEGERLHLNPINKWVDFN